jgi:hypothetical protein
MNAGTHTGLLGWRHKRLLLKTGQQSAQVGLGLFKRPAHQLRDVPTLSLFIQAGVNPDEPFAGPTGDYLT